MIEPAPGTEAAPEPVVETVETTEPVAADTAVASAEDPTRTTMPMRWSWRSGSIPANPDTDGDGVADGDEANIYLTDPFTWDTDGDGLADGDELFATSTDPLVWDTNGNGISDGEELPV